MPRPEDTGSRDVASAAAYERWRAQGDEDYEPEPRRGRSSWSGGCRCHSRSEEPCDYCSQEAPEPEEREPVVCSTCEGAKRLCSTCCLAEASCKCVGEDRLIEDCLDCCGTGEERPRGR